MNKIKKILISPKTTVVAFVLALVMLIFSMIGGARAALTYYSEVYQSQVEMRDIGITLVENGEEISCRDYHYQEADGTWKEKTGELLKNMLRETEDTLLLGRYYKEELAAKNSGTIDTYVRATVYRYWVNASGDKVREISPSTIDLHLVNLAGSEDGENCWILDKDSETDERMTLYFNRVLPQGEMTPVFSDQIKINDDIAQHVRTEETGNGMISVYDYKGYRFVVEVTVDAVQDHNAEDAIMSAWGQKVEVNDGELRLKQ